MFLTRLAVALATSLAACTNCFLATGLAVRLEASLQALQSVPVCLAITVAADNTYNRGGREREGREREREKEKEGERERERGEREGEGGERERERGERQRERGETERERERQRERGERGRERGRGEFKI